MAINVPVKDIAGKEVGSIQVKEAVFGVPMNQAVVHQALEWQRANARQGTASTKTRGEVSHTTRKPWRQKHTGRARAGTRASPLWRHGGIAFGPKPRDYHQRLPRKMRRLAVRCLLTDKRESGNLSILQDLAIAEGKTKELAGVLAALGLEGTVLLVTRDADAKVVRSARNLPQVTTTLARLLNAVELLRHRHVVATVDAIRRIEDLWHETRIDRKRVPGEPKQAAAAEPEPVPARAAVEAPASPPAAEPPPEPQAEPEAPAPERPKRVRKPATVTRSRRARKQAESES